MDRSHIYDGAMHHHVVVLAGLQGLTDSRHGDPARWNWGVTERSISEAVQRHQRCEALAAGRALWLSLQNAESP